MSVGPAGIQCCGRVVLPLRLPIFFNGFPFLNQNAIRVKIGQFRAA